MKKLIFFLLALMIAFAGCKKDKDDEDEEIKGLNPTQTQWGFVYEYTRVNCGTCGSLGGPLLHELHDMGNVVGVAGHVSGGNDPMESSYSNGFYSDRPHDGGIPFFWVCNTECIRDAALAKSTMTSFKSQTPIAGVDLSYTISGGKMSVKTKTKFFAAGTGDYLISVYVLEDNIDGGSSSGAYDQAGGSADYKHMCVLREVSASNVYGETLAASPAKDAIFEKDFEFTLDPGWITGNTHPAVVIWNMDFTANPSHVFINAKEVRN
ncbi:Omp28-related outer membrane protein [Bacteroidota bacterium]